MDPGYARGNSAPNRAMVANNQPNQSTQMRTASRPANRGQVNNNNQPSRPIQW
jgi:hypothetical protein